MQGVVGGGVLWRGGDGGGSGGGGDGGGGGGGGSGGGGEGVGVGGGGVVGVLDFVLWGSGVLLHHSSLQYKLQAIK